jgi:uncharacterized membrane protein YkvA (DUF1232 family)
MSEKGNRSLNRAKEGFFRDLYQNLRLIIRLLADPRVNFLIKILPIGALVYLVVPFDLFPVNPLDDALVIWAGCALFLELCPDDVVEEHSAVLYQQYTENDHSRGASHDVIDGDYSDL